MTDDAKTRQNFRAFVIHSDGYNVTLANVRTENGEFLPGEFQKKGKAFADVKTGDHIEFRARLNASAEGAVNLLVINCVVVLPRLYNPQTDPMNPRQMYKQLTWWGKRHPVARKKGGEVHHLIPLNALLKHGYKDAPKFHVQVSTWHHYFLHRFYARWKNDLMNWTTVKGFLWKPGATIEDGNADYMNGMTAPKFYLFRRLGVPNAQYEDFQFLFSWVLNENADYLKTTNSRQHDFNGWMKQQAAHLEKCKATGLDIDGIMMELGGISRMIQWRIEELVRELLTQLLTWETLESSRDQIALRKIQVTRRQLVTELKRSTGFLLHFRRMVTRIYNDVRLEMPMVHGLPVVTIPAQCPWSIAEIMREHLPASML